MTVWTEYKYIGRNELSSRVIAEVDHKLDNAIRRCGFLLDGAIDPVREADYSNLTKLLDVLHTLEYLEMLHMLDVIKAQSSNLSHEKAEMFSRTIDWITESMKERRIKS